MFSLTAAFFRKIKSATTETPVPCWTEYLRQRGGL